MNWGQAPFCQTAQGTALPVTTQIPLEEDGEREGTQGREGERQKENPDGKETRGRELDLCCVSNHTLLYTCYIEYIVRSH